MIKHAILHATMMGALIAVVTGCAGVSSPPKPTAGESYELGKRAYEAGRYDRAAALLRRHLDDASADSQAWYDLGNALARGGQPEQALHAYNQVVSRDASHSRARYNRGLVRLRLGVADMRRAQREGGELAPGTRARTRRYLACVIERLGGGDAAGACEPDTEGDAAREAQ